MTLRYWIRIVGAVLTGFGLLCLPSIGRSPRSYGSGFIDEANGPIGLNRRFQFEKSRQLFIRTHNETLSAA